jgi:hypothetical protein
LSLPFGGINLADNHACQTRDSLYKRRLSMKSPPGHFDDAQALKDTMWALLKAADYLAFPSALW